jgi:pimeloyl-ACP methyl ester carboxylesterase
VSSHAFEVTRQLLARGFAAATIDWRGQGGSARQLKNPRKGDIDDFSLFERDLDASIDDVLGPSCPRPIQSTAIATSLAEIGEIDKSVCQWSQHPANVGWVSMGSEPGNAALAFQAKAKRR